MKLIDNADEWLKLWSVRLALLQSLVIGLWAGFPWPSPTTDNVFRGLVFAINAAIGLSRVIKQEKLQPGDLAPTTKP